jgi:Xaa-Pro aminopeptidase
MIRKIALALAFLTLLTPFAAQGIGARSASDIAIDGSGMWHVAPVAPAIPEAERLAELAARRDSVMRRIGERGVLVLFSAEPRVYTNDVDYHYRQENNLYYLTGIKQAGATLVLIPGAKSKREILFMPRRDPLAETWTGHMMSEAEARARSGVQEVWDDSLLNTLLTFLSPRVGQGLPPRNATQKPELEQRAQWGEEFQTLLSSVAKSQGELYLILPPEKDSREYRKEQAFAAQIAQIASGLSIRNASPIFAELRLRKSPWELRLIQHAIDITDEAFHRAYALAAPGVHEYEVQAEFEYTFHRRNAGNWGYPCIVGAGANATTLHYITNQDALPSGGLLLMDCSAEFDHYTGDITRTIPVSGKFTKEQADIYNIIYEAQMESIKRVRAGNLMGGVRRGQMNPDTVQGRAAQVVIEGLYRLGLITSKDNDEYRIWFMHGTSHWIGMNVHDVGDYSTPLAPGMVLTVEPGIYVRPDALDMLPKTPENEKFIAAVRPAFEKYKGIGVRIEDDVLVTDRDPKIMSASVPSRIEEVEATMSRLKQELASARQRPAR